MCPAQTKIKFSLKIRAPDKFLEKYIIIDDNSTDKTWKIIKSFANKDTRIKAYINKRNLGIPLNRNRGIKLARGKYIVWQDADDISKKHRIKKLYEFMENNKEVGIWLH